MPTLKSLQSELEPLLKSLQPKAKLVALEVCVAYKARELFRQDQDVHEQKERLRRTILNTSRSLKSLQKNLAPLRAQVESLYDPIREARTPKTIYDLVPSSVPTAPVVMRSRLWSAADPAQPYIDFTRAIRLVERAVESEIEQIRKHTAEIRKAWKYPVNLFWTSGCFEYTLMRLFKERAKKSINVGEAQKLIAQILTRLDKGGRTPDAIRTAEKRIRTLPACQRIREACDHFLSYRFQFPLQ